MMFLYPDVMGNCICKILRCNGPLVSWQMEQPILFFNNYVNVTDVMSHGRYYIIKHFPPHLIKPR